MTDDAKKVVLLPCPFCGSDPTLEERGDGDLFVVLCQPQSSCYGSGLATFGMRSKREEAIAAWNTRQPQTDARVADLLFKLDVAATTFEKVTTSEHREAVFNAEHAKLLRDTIKVLHQPQTDALKVARERITEWCDAVADNWGQGSETHNVARDGRDIVLAALKESK
jgi:hypothetical protein